MSLQFVETVDYISGLAPDSINIELGDDDNNQTTIIGKDAAINNDGNLNTIIGYEAANLSDTASSNILIGYRAGYATNGVRNTFIGNRAGLCNIFGNDNMYLGMSVARKVQNDAMANVLLGNFTAQNLSNLGAHNVLVGHSNTSTSFASLYTGTVANNVCLGAFSDVQGCNVTAVGYSNRVVTSSGSSVIGSRNQLQSAQNSVVIGENVVNRGRGSVIINPSITGSEYINNGIEHMNFKNVLLGNRVGRDNCVNYETVLTGDDVVMKSRCSSSCNFVRASPDGIVLHSSDEAVSIESPDTKVKGDATFNSNIMILSANGGDDFWLQYVNANNELVFESKHGTTMTLVDEFRPEVLNFTGKHRCRRARGGILDRLHLMSLREKEAEQEKIQQPLLGRIVIVSCTGYCDLDGNKEISIDEAVPEVDLSTCARDKRVFGVIGGFVGAEMQQLLTERGKADDASSASPQRRYHQSFSIGNMNMRRRIPPPRVLARHREGDSHAIFFSYGIEANEKEDVAEEDDYERVVVQSVGEGAIRVCDENGPIEAGDYITTSSRPGLGMCQKESSVHHNYTVARATCDCDFSAAGEALIGCVYCC